MVVMQKGDTTWGASAPSKVNVKLRVPTTPPTVKIRGLARAPLQYAAVDDVHESVVHSAVPMRREGVVFRNTKFRPVTVNTLLASVRATLATAARVLTVGAAGGRGNSS